MITENGVSEGDYTELIDNFYDLLSPPEEEPELDQFLISGLSLPENPEILASSGGNMFSKYEESKR